jgi:Holliday junction resolvase-like predicted endonuclease
MRFRRRLRNEGILQEALAKQHLSKDDSILGSMQNHSGHGIDIVAKNKTTGETIVVQVKVNSSQFSDGQKKGANAFARDRVKRANAGEGPWASMMRTREERPPAAEHVSHETWPQTHSWVRAAHRSG